MSLFLYSKIKGCNCVWLFLYYILVNSLTKNHPMDSLRANFSSVCTNCSWYTQNVEDDTDGMEIIACLKQQQTLCKKKCWET